MLVVVKLQLAKVDETIKMEHKSIAGIGNYDNVCKIGTN
jgi:hypothetical protein